jgi:formate hydrogenlyase subunit 6/NADH:ubiquinone oxidoreductase subunit I
MSTTCVLPQVDEARCTLCGRCVEVCPCQAITLGERGLIFSCPELCPNPETCVAASDGCCLAEEICPTGAVSRAFEIVSG